MKNTGVKILVTLALLAVVIVWAVISGGGDPHDFKEKCYICHLGLKDPAIMTKNIHTLCVFCHASATDRAHPSNILPKKNLPEKYPLYNSRLVCTTCHFPHQKYGENAAYNPEIHPHLLRSAETGKVFCLSCHQAGFSSDKIDSHAVAFERAHTKQLNYEQKELLDDRSIECLSCHDGTVSTGGHNNLASANFEHKKDIGLSHPIGLDYSAAYMNNRRFLNPPSGLDKRIILVKGKIGCETCHNHFSEFKKYLVMDNFRSRLCLSCHNL